MTLCEEKGRYSNQEIKGKNDQRRDGEKDERQFPAGVESEDDTADDSRQKTDEVSDTKADAFANVL